MSIDHLNKIRDKIGKEFDEASWYGRRSLDYFEAGFDAAAAHLIKAMEALKIAEKELFRFNCDAPIKLTAIDKPVYLIAREALEEITKGLGDV